MTSLELCYFSLIYSSLGLEKGAENLNKLGKKLDPKRLGKGAVRTFKKGAFHSPFMKTKKQILEKMLTGYEAKKKKGDEVLEGKECVLLSEHDINFILTSIENANTRLDKIEQKLKEN